MKPRLTPLRRQPAEDTASSTLPTGPAAGNGSRCRRILAGFLLLGAVLAGGGPVVAQPEAARFRSLQIEDGLSQSSVYSCFQDSHGFLWFTTEDGLNRYDGYDFLVYRNDPSDPHSLSYNYVSVVYEDRSGTLWVGTFGQGLNRFDYDTCWFTRFLTDPQDSTSLSNNTVLSIHEDASGTLWFGTQEGLNRYDPLTERFHRVAGLGDGEVEPGAAAVHAVASTPEGRLWIGTGGGGLCLYEPGTGLLQCYRHQPGEPSSLPSDEVTCLTFDNAGCLWVGTNGGLSCLAPGSTEFRNYRPDPANSRSLVDERITALVEDFRGWLWVGTERGLDRLDCARLAFTHFHHDPFATSGLTSDQIHSLIVDRSHVLWVGTHTGINILDLEGKAFRGYQAHPQDPYSLSDNYVRALLEDHTGVVWVGSSGGGLDAWDRETGRFHHHRAVPGQADSLGSDYIFSLAEGERGDLWIGTTEGAYRLDRRSGRSTAYRHDPADPASLSDDVVRVVYRDRDGVFWLGTTYGLNRLDPGTGGFVRYFKDIRDPQGGLTDDFVYAICEDRRGNLWIGTLNGLSCLDSRRERFTNYYADPDDPTSLSNIEALCVFEDSQGTIWVGTPSGLNRFEPDTGTFTYYMEKDGLANDTVYAILEDAAGRLWLSTNRGLSRFDPRTETFRNYDHWDGLNSNEFNLGARLHTRAGELMFGNIKGINAFFPQEITDNDIVPALAFTDFKIFNHSVPVGDDSPLSRHISRTDAIVLSHRDYVFSIEFAALHYGIPEKNRYAYRMDGIDEDWIDIGTRRMVAYNNLPAGKYVFRVKAANCDGLWNEEGIALQIVITPPYWQTTWFRLCAALAFLALLVGIFRLRTRAIRRRALQLEERVAERTVELERANQAKSDFLANMSHEIRTPMNCIIGISDLLMDMELTRQQRHYVEMVQHAGQGLLALINDILDLSRIEAGQLLLEPTSCDLRTLCEEAMAPLAYQAGARGLDLVFHWAPGTPRRVAGDPMRIRQILINLLNNAIKFTEQGHVVLEIACERHDGQVGLFCFRVQDTGVGIDDDCLAHLFEKFTQADPSTTRRFGGSGLGLAICRQLVELMGGSIAVHSCAGQGSTFTFRIPLPSAAPGSEAQSAAAERDRRHAGAVVDARPDDEQEADFTALTPRVLLAEDNAFNQTVATHMLQKMGCRVELAANGLEAVEMLADREFDLVLMDCQMPEMDGYEATRLIRGLPGDRCRVPVIAMTAQAMAGDRELCLDSGMDDYLAKPITKHVLGKTLRRWLAAAAGVRQVAPTP